MRSVAGCIMRNPNSREAAYLAVMVYGALQKVPEMEGLHEYICGRTHEVIVELGTARGGTAWWWAHLPGFKKLISVDLLGGPFGGGPKEEDKERIRNWVSTEYDVTLCTGDSHRQETVEEVKAELPGGFCDVLFIDADHTYEGVKRDFELWSPLVKNGGCIVMHDIADHSVSNPACRVKQFWDEYLEAHPMVTHLKILYPSNPDWAGIGVIEV
jgi:cephalosporin hydroxylase